MRIDRPPRRLSDNLGLQLADPSGYAKVQQCFTATGSGDWGVHGHGTSESGTQALTYAAPTCTNLNGNSYQFAFNDMGGNPDDYDYNDLVFQLHCSGGSGSGTGTGTTGVILTD